MTYFIYAVPTVKHNGHQTYWNGHTAAQMISHEEGGDREAQDDLFLSKGSQYPAFGNQQKQQKQNKKTLSTSSIELFTDFFFTYSAQVSVFSFKKHQMIFSTIYNWKKKLHNLDFYRHYAQT